MIAPLMPRSVTMKMIELKMPAISTSPKALGSSIRIRMIVTISCVIWRVKSERLDQIIPRVARTVSPSVSGCSMAGAALELSMRAPFGRQRRAQRLRHQLDIRRAEQRVQRQRQLARAGCLGRRERPGAVALAVGAELMDRRVVVRGLDARLAQ